MANIVQNRIGVRFGVANGAGTLTLQSPATITAVTTHNASGDALVETLGPLTQVAAGDYYATVTLASYTTSMRYYLQVVYEMVSGQSQTTKKYFYITVGPAVYAARAADLHM